MLLKIHRDDPSSAYAGRLENMHITYFPEMTLFLQDFETSSEDEVPSTLVVTYAPPGTNDSKQLKILLDPKLAGAEVVDVVMHQSPTKAYNMGESYNAWFSSCFGFEVMLVYLGTSLRPILGTMSPNAAGQAKGSGKSWISSLTGVISGLGAGPATEKEGITFADVAPYLIVTQESLDDVSARLNGGEEMDITKFRPNIVLAGSKAAFDEDFWARVTATSSENQHVDFIITHNCVRCKSINIDYSTGQQGEGETGSVLKKLMKDRRIDPGKKYSPVFGRYGFLKAEGTEPKTIKIGDEVTVSQRNLEYTRFGRSRLVSDVRHRTNHATRLARVDELGTIFILRRYSYQACILLVLIWSNGNRLPTSAV